MNRTVAAIIAIVVLAVGGYFGFQAFLTKPDAPVVALTTIEGEKLTTADLRGKVVLVNFWATSCVTCVKEMPEIVATYKKYQARGFETVAVAMSYDPPNYVQNFVKKNELPFKVSLDTMGEIARGFGNVRLTPTTFILDKKGRVVARYLGEPNFAELHKLLEAKLAEAA